MKKINYILIITLMFSFLNKSMAEYNKKFFDFSIDLINGKGVSLTSAVVSLSESLFRIKWAGFEPDGGCIAAIEYGQRTELCLQKICPWVSNRFNE